MEIGPTYFGFSQRAEFSWSSDLASHGTRNDISRLRHRVLRRGPEADFVRNDLNDSNTRVVLVTLVDPVSEVTEPGSRARQTMSFVRYEWHENVHSTPVLGDDVLILTYSGDSAVGCPVCRLLVVERHVNVRIVFDFVKFVGCLVGNEDQCYLCRVGRYECC